MGMYSKLCPACDKKKKPRFFKGLNSLFIFWKTVFPLTIKYNVSLFDVN